MTLAQWAFFGLACTACLMIGIIVGVSIERMFGRGR